MDAVNVLELNASARTGDSVSRMLAAELVRALKTEIGDIALATRDLGEGIPLLSEDWIEANFTPAEERTRSQRETLSLSDTLVAELQSADIVVIGVPVYNFGIAAALKAWIDMVARARLTFRYTSDGPEGLLKNKTAYLVVASGGVPVGSPADFATPYLRHALAFLGITDVHIVAADQLNSDADAALDRARQAIASQVFAGRQADGLAA